MQKAGVFGRWELALWAGPHLGLGLFSVGSQCALCQPDPAEVPCCLAKEQVQPFAIRAWSAGL